MAFTVFQSWSLTVLSKCIANTSAALAEKVSAIPIGNFTMVLNTVKCKLYS